MNQPWKLILVLIGIFAAGVVTGGFVSLRVARAKLANRPMPEQWAPRHLMRLVERLGLTAEQQEQLRPIVRRNMEDLNRLRTHSMMETKSIFERMDREISEKLTPAQREKFEQMSREFRERARKLGQERPLGSGPRPARDRPPGEAPPPPEKPPGGE